MAPQTRGTKATKTTITKTLPTRRTAGTKTVPRVTETAAPETTEATTPELAVEAAAPQVTTAANPEVAAVAAPEEEAYNPAQALPPLLGEKPSAAFTGLLHLPTVRRPELRPARGVVNLTRMGNREAVLAQSVGAAAPSPCGLCAKKGGPWTSCVITEGFLHGSCANCHYGGSGAKCTLRQAGK
jgi:hypothetical protein